MDFETEIYNLLSGATNVVAAATGGVYSHNLPENFDFKKPSIVLQYKTDEVIDTMGSEDVLEMYTLYVIIISQSTQTNKEIAQTVRTFFNGTGTATMRDVRYMNDLNSVDFEKGYYVKSLEYKVTFEPQEETETDVEP